MDYFIFWVSAVLIIIIHELGHYIVAKKHNKFKRVVFHPLYIGIEPVFPLSFNFAVFLFASGILFSFPLALFSSLILNDFLLIVYSIALSSFDLLFLLMLFLKKRENPFFNEITEKHGITLSCQLKELV